MSSAAPAGPVVRLVAASPTVPAGLSVLLADLGNGENGFGGTPVASGRATLDEFLQHCCDMADPARLRPGLVPQTVFWALDAAGTAVGVVRLRHYLNDRLRVHGGHVGYYVRRDQRGRGYGRQMLRLALAELGAMGEKLALVTTDPGNAASIRVIEANGGRPDEASTDPDTGATVLRYWIDLEPRRRAGVAAGA